MRSFYAARAIVDGVWRDAGRITEPISSLLLGPDDAAALIRRSSPSVVGAVLEIRRYGPGRGVSRTIHMPDAEESRG